MARRRRAFSSHYCSSAILPVDLVCFEERTSSDCFNFAQNRRRRFTDLKSGVSLVASDADLLRTLSLLPTAAVGSFSEPSDLKLNGESMVLVAKVPGSFQIWRVCSPTSVFLLFVVDRDLFSVHNRSSTHPSLQSSAVSTAWTTSHHALHSHAARISLGFQVSSGRRRHGRHVPELGQTLGQELFSFWAWPINDFIKFSLMGSFGSWPSWRFCLASPSFLIVSLQGALPTVWSLAPTTPGLPCDLLQDVRLGFVRAKQQTGLPPTGSQLLSRTIASDVVCWRCGEIETIVHLVFNCPFARKVWSLAPTTPGLPCDLLQDVRSGFVRAMKQTGLPPTGLGSCRTPFPQTWISDPTSTSLMPFVGREPFSLPSSSFLKERTISHVSSSELVWSVYRCFCVARSSPVCEVCCSETSFSIIFKGSSNWCLVAFGIVAEFMIVFSGLVAKAISNNSPLLVCIVSHGTFSPPASHVVKDRGLCDDFVCLRIGTVCLYLFIYCSYAFSLALVTTLLVILMVLNFMCVTNSSRVRE